MEIEGCSYSFEAVGGGIWYSTRVGIFQTHGQSKPSDGDKWSSLSLLHVLCSIFFITPVIFLPCMEFSSPNCTNKRGRDWWERKREARMRDYRETVVTLPFSDCLPFTDLNVPKRFWSLRLNLDLTNGGSIVSSCPGWIMKSPLSRALTTGKVANFGDLQEQDFQLLLDLGLSLLVNRKCSISYQRFDSYEVSFGLLILSCLLAARPFPFDLSDIRIHQWRKIRSWWPWQSISANSATRGTLVANP